MISFLFAAKNLSFGDKKVTGLLKLYSKCREVQQEEKEKIERTRLFCKKECEPEKLNLRQKTSSMVVKSASSWPQLFFRNWNFCEEKDFVDFLSFVETKFGEFVEKVFFRHEEVFEDKNLWWRRKGFS